MNKNSFNKNGNWKGDSVGYSGIHSWVARNKKKPIFCEICRERKKLEAANISGEYKRMVIDWEWICRKCHMIKDGRLDKFIDRTINNNPNKVEERKCLNCKIKFKPSQNKRKFCCRKCYLEKNKKVNPHLTN